MRTGKELLDQVTQCYLSGMVNRFHTMPSTGRQQTVAEHTFGMLMLTTILHPNPSAALLIAITHHDGGELITGDVQYPFKNHVTIAPVLEQEELLARVRLGMMHRFEDYLTGDDMRWLDAVDKIEALLYARHQVKSGNDYYKEVVVNVIGWLQARQYRNTLPDELEKLLWAIEEKVK